MILMLTFLSLSNPVLQYPFFHFPAYPNNYTVPEKTHCTRKVTGQARWGRRQLEFSNRKLLDHSKSLDVLEEGL